VTTFDPALLDGLFPEDVHVAARALDPAQEVGFRFPEEAAHVAGAVAKRRVEFATGRELVHELLDGLGVPAAPLLVDGRRAPIWPAGVRGAISHTYPKPGPDSTVPGLCAAAVSTTRAHLGLDVEATAPLDRKLWPSVLTISERARLEGLGGRGALLSKIHFSGKEAVYKAISARVGRVVGFEEVELGVSLARGTFEVTPMLKDGAALPRLHGRWRVTRDFIATSVVADE